MLNFCGDTYMIIMITIKMIIVIWTDLDVDNHGNGQSFQVFRSNPNNELT